MTAPHDRDYNEGERLEQDQHDRALAMLPPGRSLAAEYLRLHAACTAQSAQLVRAIELRVQADQRAGKRNVARLEQVIKEQAEVIEIACAVASRAPWLSCAHLQQKLQHALADQETSGGAWERIQELFDVDLDQARTPAELADLKAKGLLPR